MRISTAFDHFSSGLKNCVHVAVVAILAIGFISGWLQRKTASALDVFQQHGVTKFEYDKLKLEFQTAKAEKEKAQTDIQNLVNNPTALNSVPSKTPNPQDGAPNSTIAKALISIDEPGSSWVYIGQYRNGKYLRHPNFESPGVPNVGDELSAWTDTYRRDGLPVKMGPNNWKLGEIVGVVKVGQKVRVKRVERIEDDNYWLQVTSVATWSQAL